MDWSGARERLGAELIGAREQVTLRWRQRVAESGQAPSALEALAVEMVLQAGAALADGCAPEWPWTRCGGVLRVDARRGERALHAELTALWDGMAAEVARHALTSLEQRSAVEVLSRQLEAALRGATAEVQGLLRGDEVADPALRFGGVKLLLCPAAAAVPATRAA